MKPIDTSPARDPATPASHSSITAYQPVQAELNQDVSSGTIPEEKEVLMKMKLIWAICCLALVSVAGQAQIAGANDEYVKVQLDLTGRLLYSSEIQDLADTLRDGVQTVGISRKQIELTLLNGDIYVDESRSFGLAQTRWNLVGCNIRLEDHVQSFSAHSIRNVTLTSIYDSTYYPNIRDLGYGYDGQYLGGLTWVVGDVPTHHQWKWGALQHALGLEANEQRTEGPDDGNVIIFSPLGKAAENHAIWTKRGTGIVYAYDSTKQGNQGSLIAGKRKDGKPRFLAEVMSIVTFYNFWKTGDKDSRRPWSWTN